MREWFPLLVIGALVGAATLVLLIAYRTLRKDHDAIGFDRHMSDREILRRLARYARPHLGKLLLVLLIMLFSISYDILSPLLIGQIEEMVKADFPLSKLFWMVGICVSVLIVSLIATYAQEILLQKIGQRILSTIREELFAHVESLSHGQLSTMPVGKLVTRVAYDTNDISIFFTKILVNLVKNFALIFGVLAAMLFCNYLLTLMVLCFVPFVFLFTLIFRKFLRRAFRRVKDGKTDINTFLSEHLSGMKVIQIFNREDDKMKEFEKKNETLGRAKEEQIMVFSVFRPLVYMLYISSVMCLFYLGGRGVIQNTEFLGQIITSGTIVTFYMYISKFFTPIQNLAEQFNRLQSAFASSEKIFTLFDIQPDVVDQPGAKALPSVKGQIEFRHVWFAYIEGEWVLRDVSFTVSPGETLALVGATGSGKTTILSLLCRNYDIQKGTILLDGVDIRTIPIPELRRHFGQMLQDVFLFSGTVRSNLILREESFTEEQIWEACRYVGAETFLKRLPDQLEETVRERGANFSAGQRQLLSFSRAILHRPEIMILDEATANIDSETEQLIQSSLEKMMRDGTMIIVAHRLSTIRNADKILVLSHGEILEQGSHDELLEKKGRYYELYRMQFEEA